MAASSKEVTMFFLYILGFVDLLGVSMTIPILSRHARDLGASPTVIGILGSTYGLLQLFSSPVVGYWSDRAGRRHVLMWTLLLSSFGYFLLASSTSILLLFISRIPTGLFKHSLQMSQNYLGTVVPQEQHPHVLGRFHAFSNMGFIIGPIIGGHLSDLPGGFQLVASTTTALFLANVGLFKQTQSLAKVALADITPKEEHAHIFGRFNAIATMGFIVGPVIGGHLVDLPNGFHLVALTTSLAFLINAGLVWYFIPPESQDGKESSNKSPSMNTQFNFFKNMGQINWAQLWDIFLVRFFLGFAVIVYRTNFSLTLDMKFQISGKQLGYIISFSSIIGTLSGFIVGRISTWYNNDHKLLLHVSLLELLSIASLTFAPSLTVLVLSLAPLSLATAIARVCSTNLTIDRIRGDEAGAVLGFGASVLSTARMVSPVVGGLSQELSVAGPGIIAMVASGIGSLILMFSNPKAKGKTGKLD